ncbi:MAG: N-acetylglucosamine-6-phosphate deacetylase [Oscillospiraceae bacterium]|nr:N-acetylglucosamine-6-phosphate deacetylase [Oscillospiraceae bacterium]
MLFKNALLFRGGRYVPGAFRVEDDRFTDFFDADPAGDGVDLGGAKVIPGLIDVHSHGNSGADFSDGDYDGLARMAAYYAKNGITGFAPASMTLPYETLEAAFATAARLHRERPAGCARLLGIQMEGPFFSEKKKGAQNADYLRLPDFEAFRKLYEGCGGLIRIADVAPELEGAEDFIRRASELCTVSVAHTDASYEDAKTAFAAGARHVTHLFNAMPPIHHRKPGVIGAAAEREDVVAELISDGQHLHPSIVRMAFRLFPGRVCLISDSLRCCGMPDGEYELGGQQVFLQGGIARLADGTIAGSATNLFECMRRAISFGVPEEEAITAATLTPAREIGTDGLVGSLEVGKLADFVVCDRDLNALSVWLGGQKIMEEQT